MDDQEFYLTSGHVHKISCVMLDVQRLPLYPYPWTDLEDILINNKTHHLSLVAYGSLINSESAKRTLPPAILHRSKPVVAFGVRRVFDYIMPEETSRYGKPTNPLARAALNVHVTENIDDRVNGILIDLSWEEMPAMQSREVDYDLVPVACIDWTNRNHSYPAYILRSEQRVNSHLVPHQAYYKVCRHGAAQVSQEFLSLWLNTTFLGDRETPVKHWEAKEFPSE